jgi:2,4-dienoyl-CoA reductase-like NADH-dependent reductase (Old Yellow Enzyme family)
MTQAATRLRRLFEPGRIGTMQLKNRITMAPMGTQMYAEGFVTEQLKDYYEARARGGVGLITIDHLKFPIRSARAKRTPRASTTTSSSRGCRRCSKSCIAMARR